MNKGPAVPTTLAVGILALAVGAAAGYYGRYFQESGQPVAAGGGSTRAGGPGGPGGGPGGGMGGGMGGGQNQPQNGMALARLVRNLNTVQKAQSKGVTPQQAAAIAPILKSLKPDDKLADADAKAKVDEIEKVLTPEQKEVLAALTPQRGGGGGGGGMGGGMGGASGGGASGGAPGMSPGMTAGSAGRMPSNGGPGRAPGVPAGAAGGGPGGGAGGGRPDPEKPFASERNKQALDDLIAALGK